MTSKVRQVSRSRRLLVWSWVPAVVVTAFTILTAAGISLVPMATSATSGTALVNAQVADALNVDMSGCGGPLDLGQLSLTAAVDSDTEGDSCSVDFSTNDPQGARLELSDNNAAADGGFLCHTVNGCAAGADGIGEGAGAGPFGIDTADSFGAALIAVGGDGNAVWNLNNPIDYTADWYGLADNQAGVEACDSGGGDTVASNCDFTFGARMGADNPNGSAYTGTVYFEVINE